MAENFVVFNLVGVNNAHFSVNSQEIAEEIDFFFAGIGVEIDAFLKGVEAGGFEIAPELVPDGSVAMKDVIENDPPEAVPTGWLGDDD